MHKQQNKIKSKVISFGRHICHTQLNVNCKIYRLALKQNSNEIISWKSLLDNTSRVFRVVLQPVSKCDFHENKIMIISTLILIVEEKAVYS